VFVEKYENLPGKKEVKVKCVSWRGMNFPDNLYIPHVKIVCSTNLTVSLD